MNADEQYYAMYDEIFDLKREVKSLIAQLAASQRRESAAVRDLTFACGSQPSASDDFSICDICKHKQEDGSCPKQCFMNSLGAINRWEWRGVEAGKEGAE